MNNIVFKKNIHKRRILEWNPLYIENKLLREEVEEVTKEINELIYKITNNKCKIL